MTSDISKYHLFRQIARIATRSVGKPIPIPTPNAILSEVLSPPFPLDGALVGSGEIVDVECIVSVFEEVVREPGIDASAAYNEGQVGEACSSYEELTAGDCRREDRAESGVHSFGCARYTHDCSYYENRFCSRVASGRGRRWHNSGRRSYGN